MTDHALTPPTVTPWRRWLERPQGLLLRRVLFQVHLWVGIAFGIYLLVICLTGSILVYRNELYRTFSPIPVIVSGSGTPLDAEAVKSAARRAYPEHEVTDIHTGKTPNHAVEVTLRRGSDTMRRLLHPFTGADLGNPVPAGYRFTTWMLDLHDNLLAGDTGRAFNGIGALALTLLSLTGVIIWWPGIASWRRSLIPDLRANWKRLNWTLHSAFGAWGLVFILLYFLLPRNFLVAHSNNYITALNCRGPLDKYHEFADAVMQAAIGKQEGAQESGHGARTHAVVAPPQLAPPSASVRCPGCGTEYKLPPNAAGRRLRCQKCQSLVG